MRLEHVTHASSSLSLSLLPMCAPQLTEDQTATIMQATLQGLEFLHSKRKIHRLKTSVRVVVVREMNSHPHRLSPLYSDIKAGNILLTTNGNAKLGATFVRRSARGNRDSTFAHRP